MRILQVAGSYPPTIGGVARHVATLSRLLAERGHEVTVMICGLGAGRDSPEPGGVWIVEPGGSGRLPGLRRLLGVTYRLLRGRWDMIHVHVPCAAAPAGLWLSRSRTPYVLTWHQDPDQQYPRSLPHPLRKWLLRGAGRIVITTPALANQSPVLGPFLEKVRVVPVGIDLPRLAKTPEVETRVSAIRAETVGGHVLYVGPLLEGRGIEYLLQAMIGLNATLSIIGIGLMEDKLKGMAEDLGIAERVRFRGQVTDLEVVAHLHACDCVVLPSLSGAGPFGLVQLEAMACAKPVVSTRPRDGLPFVNLDGVTGYVVSPRDSSALAHRIKGLLQDWSRRTQMGEQARRRVEQDFVADGMVDSIVRQYGDALELKGKSAKGKDTAG